MEIQKKNLVIVDDMRTNLLVMSQILSPFYNCHTFTSSKEYLEFKSNSDIFIDLFILDIFMPEVDGYELAGKITKDDTTADTPILFITGVEIDEAITEEFSKYTWDVLPKGVSSKQLLLRIKNLITVNENRRRLEIENQNKSILFQMIFHDLNNPLALINGYMMIYDINKEQFKPERIIRSINSISGILNIAKLLSFGQIDKLSGMNFTIKDLLEHLSDATTSALSGKNLNIETIVDCEGTEVVIGDLNVVLHNILMNYFRNSVKFSNENETIQIIINKLQNGFIQFQIKDNGTGIPKEKLALISKGLRVKSGSGTSGEVGTGFGTSIAQFFIKKLNGDIKIDSQLKTENSPGWTTITINLPSA